jgi:cardiolipin synthase
VTAPDREPRGRGQAAISHAVERVTGAPLRRGNRLTLLRDGGETYADWLAAIGRARRWVHLDNYIFRADAIGHQFADALAERAAAGVAVRVLVDWYGSWDVPGAFWRGLRERGVDVRMVNPPRPIAPLDVFQRDHRKALAVDGDYASAGGVCIADQWLERSPRTGLPYRDTAVSVRGPAVADIERAFADVWARNGAPLPAAERTDYESHLAAARSGLSDKTFTELWRRGREMKPDAAIAYALKTPQEN